MNIARLIINNMFIINGRGVADHEKTETKMTWRVMAIILVMLIIFGLAMMGSVLGSKSKELLVALVVLDQPAELATGGMLAVGEIIQETLGSNPALPFVWHVVDSEEKARKGIDNHDFYGAVVLPVDLSTGLLSLATSSPIHLM
ncbi:MULTISPECIES: YhgE/Pip domain-containing protein [Paenibacillus]|uniref:YhgE/Pip domain-containing protein n=1 Tax=Paenibacillus TaxID=44249 RepID=UPI000B9FF260|nr:MULTISPECIES: ABC transporter permease [Paenibacillus]OZQ64470.1 hypothetical protein CA599_22350 [Paenibacillus taichungensis]